MVGFSQEVIPMRDNIRICWLGVLFVAILLGLRFASAVDTKTDTLPDITAKSLVVKGGAGSVTIRGDERGAGIWLTAPNGEQVAVVGGYNHPTSVMLYSNRDIKQGGGATLALAVDGDSSFIQVRDKSGKITIIPVEKLARAAAWLQTQPKE
jgi:hypothetical protein